jgi:hypothetical protein
LRKHFLTALLSEFFVNHLTDLSYATACIFDDITASDKYPRRQIQDRSNGTKIIFEVEYSFPGL